MEIDEIKSQVESLPKLSSYIDALSVQDRPYLTEYRDLEFPPQLCCGITRELPVVPVILNERVYDLGNLLGLAVDTAGRRHIDDFSFSLNDIKIGEEVVKTTQQYYERMTQPRLVKISPTLRLAISAYAYRKRNCQSGDVKKEVFAELDRLLTGVSISLDQVNAILTSLSYQKRCELFAAWRKSDAAEMILALYRELGVEEIEITDLTKEAFKAPGELEKRRAIYNQTLVGLRLLLPWIGRREGENSFKQALGKEENLRTSLIKMALIFLELDSRGVFVESNFSLPPLGSLCSDACVFLRGYVGFFKKTNPALNRKIAQALVSTPRLRRF